ncbi:hypothetical protein Nepgr_032974 [Nepenthes gracilis]|uniref:C2 NT-type domain-containing protein n=1 Tax=Nepenthes gracilis TaxID=150966 RepID=A0AAD3TL97_NEPGR|nr:hypothetical protein Nepgr_032974 [Nepenthes gracilis]
MVLSLRTKSKRGPTVRFDYIVHVQEIKPWPPSQSLKNIHSVFIQWENGDRSSAATSIVMPSVDDGKIEFSDYFRLPVILLRDSVTALMSEEYAEEAELASLADDVVSSHSSLVASSASGSLALPKGENGSGVEKENHLCTIETRLAKVFVIHIWHSMQVYNPIQGLSAWTSTNYRPGCVNVACAIARDR